MKYVLSTISTLLLAGACQRSPTASNVTFVDQSQVSVSSDPAEREDPLLLVVEIAEDGKLSLNKIDVGTTADLDPIGKKLEAIFADRTRAGIGRKDLLVEMNGTVSREELERVIEGLSAVNATPIRVVKGGL